MSRLSMLWIPKAKFTFGAPSTEIRQFCEVMDTQKQDYLRRLHYGFKCHLRCAASGENDNIYAVVRVPKSCGRLHASSLDSEGQIWTFPSWGRPFRLVSDLFTDPGSKPLQIECGWAFSSVLTVTGDVFIWWPFSGETAQRIRAINNQMNEQGDKKASAQPDNSIPCVTWDLNEDPARLPSIPTLPDLPDGGNEDKPTQLIQIAGLDEHIIGLTNKGHVLKFNGLQSKATLSGGSWKYLPAFSEIETVQSQFAQLGLDSPNSLKITHISANFLNFIAYSTGSSSVVLIGNTDTTSESKPKIVPDLQNKSIISVVLGDYHNAALTSNGKVYTWGAYSLGALGLGDPAALTPGTPGGFDTEDERIRAEHGRRVEVSDVDVPTEPDDEEEEVELESEDRPLPPRMYDHQTLPGGQGPPIIPFLGFRVGFAGRGGNFGRGRGLGRG
ncbi:hypothetical protein DXG01_013744 [Tephrocybe rancida]|nr:hypothetical protein DXG01_013744 [Tephrocybe rancida]